MKLIKTYNEPTNIYIVGSGDYEMEEEDACLHITDDYCSGSILTNKGFNGWIETEGAMSILTEEKFIKNLQEREWFDVESIELIEIKDFIGDIYVQLLDENGVDCLKENPNLNKDLTSQYKEGLKHGWRDVTLVLSGNYKSIEKREYIEFENIWSEAV